MACLLTWNENVHVSKHKRTQEWKSIPSFRYPFQVSKHAINFSIFVHNNNEKKKSK